MPMKTLYLDNPTAAGVARVLAELLTRRAVKQINVRRDPAYDGRYVQLLGQVRIEIITRADEEI